MAFHGLLSNADAVAAGWSAPARADTAQELVHVLCLPCLVCLPGLEGCFCVGGRLWDKWGLCSWEALGFSMEEVRRQHPGGRYWLTPPYNCLVSGSSWA